MRNAQHDGMKKIKPLDKNMHTTKAKIRIGNLVVDEDEYGDSMENNTEEHVLLYK